MGPAARRPRAVRARNARARERESMAKKLFIGGLTGHQRPGLRNAFSKFARSPRHGRDRPESGRSRGFGFVTFEDGEAADSAMQAMNGATLDGARSTSTRRATAASAVAAAASGRGRAATAAAAAGRRLRRRDGARDRW